MIIKELLQKLNEVLTDTVDNAVHIYEMSQPQGKVRQMVRDLSEPIFEHIIKILLYGKQENSLHHWCAELNTWFAKCMKKNIKRKGKDYPPTEMELYTWLTDYYSSVNDVQGVKRYIEALFYEKEHEQITDEELYQNYINILKECCKLAANKQNSVTEIEKVINKYI